MILNFENVEKITKKSEFPLKALFASSNQPAPGSIACLLVIANTTCGLL
ncbi:MAG TPA: hypothetical protein PKA79_06765 [Oligoflexia bacterium]|nr:hypothetical protein [Oligoflexia bacterium]